MEKQTFYVPQQLVPTRVSALLAERSVYMNKPKMQRSDKTWPRRKKQAFIESLLRGIPVPSMILHHDAELRGDKLWIADGLQRLTAICDFADGKFKTGRNRPGAPTFGVFEPNCSISQLSSIALSQFRGYHLPIQVIETAETEIIKFVFMSVQNGVLLTLGERLYAQGFDSDSVLAIEQIEEHDFFSAIYPGSNEHREVYMMAQFPIILELNGLFAGLDGERLRNLASDVYAERITNAMLERIEENLMFAQHLFDGVQIASKNEVALMYQAIALLRLSGFDLNNADPGALANWYRENVPDQTLDVTRKAFNTVISQINKHAVQAHFWQMKANDIAHLPGLHGNAESRNNMDRLAMWLHYRHYCPGCGELIGDVHKVNYHRFLPTDRACLSQAAIQKHLAPEMIGAD